MQLSPFDLSRDQEGEGAQVRQAVLVATLDLLSQQGYTDQPLDDQLPKRIVSLLLFAARSTKKP